ncbi:chondroitin synthase [bacterium BMS3Bbin04]|nr:chondroitin synthase [bacterium BMS3Bbin04]
MEPKFKISVVVPFHGREDFLRLCLASLCIQTLDPDDYEVIVVDDGGYLSAAAILELGQRPVRIMRKSHTGVCRTRNMGINQARSELIVLFDYDCVASQTLLQRYVKFFADNTAIAGAGGTVVSIGDKKLLSAYAGRRGLLSGPIRIGNSIQSVITANACFRKSALQLVGLFDTLFDDYFHSCGGEDADLSYRLLQRGFMLGSCPQAIASHNHRINFKEFVIQQTRNGEGLLVHARLRDRKLSDFDLPEPRLLPIVFHIVQFLFLPTPSSPRSLMARCRDYWHDSRLSWFEKLAFPCVDLLRRCCYLAGLVRGQRGLRLSTAYSVNTSSRIES